MEMTVQEMRKNLICRVDEGRTEETSPESSLGVTRNAACRSFNSSLLRERSRRTAFLTTLLLHLLSGWRSHALVGRTWLLHTTIAVVFLRKLSLLLGGVVLERHCDRELV